MKLPHNRTWYTKKLVEKAKLCVKLRDDYTCQRCNKEVSGSNCHASHVLNVGTHKNMELDPINMKVLCSYCHLHWWHKDVLHATEWFKDKFLLRYDVLMRMAKLKFKISTADLAELHDTTKADGSDYGQAYYKLIQEIINESH
jgi:alpha-galactosidase/6-phospho-beta-glucosidase family protein